MVSHWCRFFHVSSMQLIVYICNHTFCSWRVLWVFKIYARANFLSHIEQLKGFLSKWNLSWIFKIPALENFLPHFEQQNGFSPVQVLSCTFNVADSLKISSHIEQLEGFLSIWILSWILKVPARVNFASHFEQQNVFLQNEFHLWVFKAWISCHTSISGMVSQQCGFVHESSNDLMCCISCPSSIANTL